MNKNRKPILIYILAVLVLGIFIYLVPMVTDAFDSTTVLEEGIIQVSEEADCYFVRHETVYEAGTAGTVEYKIKEGTHIRTGTILANFKADESDNSEVMAARSKYADIIENVGDAAVRTKSFEAKSSGVISYWADGYEASLTPQNMGNLSRDKAQEITAKPVELKQSPVRKTEPVLKICDNDNWYIICWVESASIANYEVGNKVSITLPAGTVDMKIKSITQDGDYWKLIFWSNNYYEEFAKSRVEEGLIMSRYYEGLKTETGNIITYVDEDTKEKTLVVLKMQKNGDLGIVPVKVRANDGEFSILEEGSFVDEKGILHNTVNMYDEILKNPSKHDLETAVKAMKGDKNED